MNIKSKFLSFCNISTACGLGIVVDVKEDVNEVSNISWASGLDTGVDEVGHGDFEIVRPRFAPTLALLNIFRYHGLELLLDRPAWISRAHDGGAPEAHDVDIYVYVAKDVRGLV